MAPITQAMENRTLTKMSTLDIAARLGRAVEWVTYEATTEGLGSPLESCSECNRETFVVSEERCGNCGFSLRHRKCVVCSDPLTLDDYCYGDGGLVAIIDTSCPTMTEEWAFEFPLSSRGAAGISFLVFFHSRTENRGRRILD
jgi:hypothetical protein